MYEIAEWIGKMLVALWCFSGVFFVGRANKLYLWRIAIFTGPLSYWLFPPGPDSIHYEPTEADRRKYAELCAEMRADDAAKRAREAAATSSHK